MKVESLENEIWKEVPGLNGYYLASNFGRIYSIEREFNYPLRNGQNQIRKSVGKLLNQLLTPGGYLRIQISIDGFKRKYYSHVLIARAFLNSIEGKEVVNHKDLNKTNNNIDNLEWVNSRENSIHYFQQNTKTGRAGIHYRENRSRYNGLILHKGKRHNCGYHKTFELAEIDYNNKIKELGLS
jgi:hypothetical protein